MPNPKKNFYARARLKSDPLSRITDGGGAISISEARDLHGLHTDELVVLLWFVQNGTAIGDRTIAKLCAETGLLRPRVFACIRALAEDGILQVTPRLALVMPGRIEGGCG